MTVLRALVGALLLLVATSTAAQSAMYDAATRILSIPAVKVGSTTYTGVTLYNEGDFVFALLTAAEQVTPMQAAATYDERTQILTLPSVVASGLTYVNVTLRNNGGYRFSLISATEQLLNVPVAAINAANRNEVLVRWNDTYLDVVPYVWTGDVNNCQAGDTPTAFKQAVLRRLNYYRAMAGLPGNLMLDFTLSAKAQKAALMMDASNSLSHFPGTDWICYSADGAEAAGRSNLAYTTGPRGVSILDGYMTDRGTNNTFVGHRRWILYSRLAIVGSGDAPQANALWVVGSGTTGAPAAKIGVPWPPAGFMPRPLQPPTDRFSYSCPSANFSNATVTMRGDVGQAIATRVESRTDNGYGDNTIVWSIDTGLSPTSGWDRGTADTLVAIELADIANCAAGSTMSYTVTFITP